MSIEHNPSRDRAAFTISEFCEAHRVSRSKYYKLKHEGRGPLEIDLGGKKLITVEAAALWRRQLEAESAAAA